MAVILRDLFAHPLPETLNRVEVRAVAGQGQEGEAQLGGCGLHDLGFVTRCTVPDNHDRARAIAQPGGEMLEELDGVVGHCSCLRSR